MPARDRLGVLITLIAAGLFCSSGLALPPREVSLCGRSFPLTGEMLFGFVLLGLTCTGVTDIVHRHPRRQPQRLSHGFLHWVLPTALTAIAYAFLSRVHGVETKVVGVGAASTLLTLLIVAEYYTMDPAGRWRSAVRFFLRFIAYLLAVLLYAAIRRSASADLSAALAAAVVSGIMALRLLCDRQCPLEQVGPCVLGLGTLLGIGFWLLSLLAASPLEYSLALVVLLYVLTGLVRQFLLGKLTLEYVFAGGLVLLLLLSRAR